MHRPLKGQLPLIETEREREKAPQPRRRNHNQRGGGQCSHKLQAALAPEPTLVPACPQRGFLPIFRSIIASQAHLIVPPSTGSTASTASTASTGLQAPTQLLCCCCCCCCCCC
ncbi:hypothetical protein M758_2G007500 [Ceratodon purpureus]|nr:hypothetical protein M758_2G007500 [Ceratodon purpureus]